MSGIWASLRVGLGFERAESALSGSVFTGSSGESGRGEACPAGTRETGGVPDDRVGVWLDSVEVGWFDIGRHRRAVGGGLRGSDVVAGFVMNGHWVRYGLMARDFGLVADWLPGRYWRKTSIMLELSGQDWNNRRHHLTHAFSGCATLDVLIWPSRQGAGRTGAIPALWRRSSPPS